MKLNPLQARMPTLDSNIDLLISNKCRNAQFTKEAVA